MLPNTLNLNNSSVDKIYAQPTRSRYSDESKILTSPFHINFGHMVNKDGTVSTVASIDNDKLVTGREIDGFARVKTQVKFAYNPLKGRSDIKASILADLADLANIVTDNIDSLINKEV